MDPHDSEPAASGWPERLERLSARAGPAVGIVLLLAAGWAVHRTLHGVHWGEIQHQLWAIGPARWSAAIALTALSYCALAATEWLASRHVGLPVPPGRVLGVGLLGWAVSNTVGHAWLSGGAVRMRLYGGWGVGAGDVGRVIAFDTLTFALGWTLVTGTALTLSPPTALAPWGRYVGIALLVGLAVALLGIRRRREPLSIGGWSLALPGGRTLVAQLGVAAVDQLAAIGALFVLLPGAHVPYVELVSLFLVSLIAGIASGVPGGAGTLDGTLITLGSAEGAAAAMVAGVLGWRLVYNLLPLALAAVAMATIEVRRARGGLASEVGDFGARLARSLAPPALAGLAFASGLLLLLSALTPAEPLRLRWLAQVEPLALLETSHAGSAVVGVLLLFVARGLLLRLRAAWGTLLALTVVGGVLSITKGLDWEEAVALVGVLMVALPARREFYRTAALAREIWSPAWTLAVTAAVAVTGLVLVHATLHVPWRSELLWTFAERAEASRSLRAFGIAVAMGAAAVIGSTLRPVRLPPPPPTGADLDDALRISREAGASSGGLSGLGDKALLFDDERRAFLMYGVSRGVWVCFASPVGPPERAAELMWQFRQLAARAGARIALYEVKPALLPLCVDLGLQVFKFGEEAVVPVAAYTLEGSARRKERNLTSRMARDGATFEVLPAEQVSEVVDRLREVSDAWLSEKASAEKGFSLGCFDPAYLERQPVAVVRLEGRIVAFANLLSAPPEVSVDLMRFHPDAPNGAMDFLFVSLFLWAAEHGYERFVLGMTPLAGLPDRDLAPLWARVGALVFRNGEAFYNFQGLRAYKEKYKPTWEPRYLAVQGGMALPATLRAINALVSGSVLGALPK